MISGYDVVCFCNDWESDPLSKKHIMIRLAKRNRVLWVNSIGNRTPTVSMPDLRRIVRKLGEFTRGCRQVDERLSVFTPVAIPFHGNPIAREFNRRFLRWTLARLCRQLGFRAPLVWTFLPTTAGVAGGLGEQLLIYHCVDEFSEFTGTDKEAILGMERSLMRQADAVIVSSERLHASKRAHNPNTFLVRHGVDTDHFRKAVDAETPVPADIAFLPRPMIGFYGLIADWVDLDLIRLLALQRPHWSIVLIGKVCTDTSSIRDLPNVHLLGRRDYEVLPGYCKAFDVAILPFVINELTLCANPLKLREYLAAGLPVVSSALPEAEPLAGLVLLADSHDAFLRRIDRVLEEGRAGPDIRIAREMEPESWDARVEQLSNIVQSVRRLPRHRGLATDASRTGSAHAT